MKVLSIDIGITNLGYVFADLNFNTNLNIIKNNIILDRTDYISILKCDRVDITIVKHNKTSLCNCKLHHENCIPDYLDHFIQEHDDIFETAEIILIERQPPVGITNVQDLLFTKFRSKVKLISPSSVHKFFNMSREYLIRKEQSEDISMKYLYFLNNFMNNTRKHDMSDAMLMILYYYKIKNEEIIKNTKSNLIIDFEKFRFDKNTN